jgi:hypothetical protein
MSTYWMRISPGELEYKMNEALSSGYLKQPPHKWKTIFDVGRWFICFGLFKPAINPSGKLDYYGYYESIPLFFNIGFGRMVDRALMMGIWFHLSLLLNNIEDGKELPGIHISIPFWRIDLKKLCGNRRVIK